MSFFLGYHGFRECFLFSSVVKREGGLWPGPAAADRRKLPATTWFVHVDHPSRVDKLIGDGEGFISACVPRNHPSAISRLWTRPFPASTRSTFCLRLPDFSSCPRTQNGSFGLRLWRIVLRPDNPHVLAGSRLTRSVNFATRLRWERLPMPKTPSTACSVKKCAFTAARTGSCLGSTSMPRSS